MATDAGDPAFHNSVPQDGCVHPIPEWEVRERPGRGLEIDLYCIYCDSGQTVTLSFEGLLSDG